MARTPNSSIAVPIASVTKFAAVLRTAGAVQNTPSFVAGSSVRRQWGRYVSHASTAPRNAPIICAETYPATFIHGKLPMVASAIVTAGLRCAPLMRPTAYTAIVTATPHPTVMTIQPEFAPFDRARRTFATTPSPSRIRIIVPTASATYGFMAAEPITSAEGWGPDHW